MPKIKTNRVKYPEGWEADRATLRELEQKMREAESDTHEGKRKCEALWPIFKISHQKSRYIYDLYYRARPSARSSTTSASSRSTPMPASLPSGRSRGLSGCAVCDACSPRTTTSAPLVCAGCPSTYGGEGDRVHTLRVQGCASGDS
ncbi:hypothetical protein CLOM_g3712 [Closterium sp. NIES-68]|nr:hypothetical protein CLOM_g3712 [Closterium sp. NIES-68]